ncbi:hypothetical protein KCP76_02410 [Salmonella enterica subsp. enterica serovar Weltevreden]|nr:hypothetical protein KCP76_02410 [Salmonella enterica subsp. enterica serovar Weltevreden]
MYKRPGDGIVRVDTRQMRRLWLLRLVLLPYGAPQLNEQTGQMSKCDMRVDLPGESVNRPSVLRPVRWRPSGLARLMNCARSTVAYATLTGCQIHP